MSTDYAFHAKGNDGIANGEAIGKAARAIADHETMAQPVSPLFGPEASYNTRVNMHIDQLVSHFDGDERLAIYAMLQLLGELKKRSDRRGQ